MNRTLLALAGVFLFSCASRLEEEATVVKPKPDAMGSKQCLEEVLTIGPENIRGSFPGEPLGNREKFSAADIDGSYSPVEAATLPLLWLNASRSDVVVDRALFPDGFSTISLMRMSDGTSRVVGRVSAEGLKRVMRRDLIRFLLLTEIIETRVHVEAEICLVSREETASSLSERYEGSHTYYTNERNVVALSFTVTIDGEGVIRVRSER